MLEMSFSVCRFGAYSNTRRGWPRSPTRKSGKNVQVEEDEERPEVPLAEPAVHRLPGDLREPVVEAAEQGEDQAAHDRVVEVRQHEEAAVHGDVDRDVGEEHAGHPADQEVEQHPETEEHRGLEPDLRLPERPERHQEEEPGRDRDELGREHEQRPHVRVDAALEEVVLPDEEGQQRHAEHARPPPPCRRRAACG